MPIRTRRRAASTSPRSTQQLGIDAALKDKLTYSNALDGGVQRITAGEAEIGIYPVSEVIAVQGIALVGLLPPALQSLIVYGAAVLAASAAPEPAGAFIAFLTDRRASAGLGRGGVRTAEVAVRLRGPASTPRSPAPSPTRSCAGWCRGG